uniref:Uncharacterized protein n=1 Tax=Mustela putorius furo TaxID=9669 RepID=M3YFV7_MUSPF
TKEVPAATGDVTLESQGHLQAPSKPASVQSRWQASHCYIRSTWRTRTLQLLLTSSPPSDGSGASSHGPGCTCDTRSAISHISSGQETSTETRGRRAPGRQWELKWPEKLFGKNLHLPCHKENPSCQEPHSSRGTEREERTTWLLSASLPGTGPLGTWSSALRTAVSISQEEM